MSQDSPCTASKILEGRARVQVKPVSIYIVEYSLEGLSGKISMQIRLVIQ